MKKIILLSLLLITLSLIGTASAATQTGKRVLVNGRAIESQMNLLFEQRRNYCEQLNIEQQRLRNMVHRGKSAQNRLIWNIKGKIHDADKQINKLAKKSYYIVRQAVDTIVRDRIVYQQVSPSPESIDSMVNAVVAPRLLALEADYQAKLKAVTPARTPAPAAIDTNGALVYKIQFASTKKYDKNATYNHLTEITTSPKTTNGWIKLYTGSYASFSAARAALQEVLPKYKDAFVVAFYKGRCISVNEARKIEIR